MIKGRSRRPRGSRQARIRRAGAASAVRGACVTTVVLLAAACSSGPSTDQAQALARQTRTATAREFFGVFGEITPDVHQFPGDSAGGGFGPCPEVSRDDQVSYGVSADIFPKDQNTNGGAHALVQELEPMLRAHGWGRWQSTTGSLNSQPAQPYVVSKQRGYDLYLQVQPAGGGDVSVFLLVGGPCVAVGKAEATELISAVQDGRYGDRIDISPGSAQRVPTSPVPTPTS